MKYLELEGMRPICMSLCNIFVGIILDSFHPDSIGINFEYFPIMSTVNVC